MTRRDDFGTHPHVLATERWFEVLERGAAAELAAEYAVTCEAHWRNAAPERSWNARWKAMRRRTTATA